VSDAVPALLGRDAAFALQTVASAARVARALEPRASEAHTKPDTSPVTLADLVVQAVIAARLAREYPDDEFVAEEDATTLYDRGGVFIDRLVELVRQVEPAATCERVQAWIDRGRGTPGRRFWTLDPIDGTKGLLRGGQYAIALALVVGGTVQVAALGCPRLRWPGRSASPPSLESGAGGGLALAVRGAGAWWLAEPDRAAIRMAVSTIADPAHARVVHSVEAGHSDRNRLRDVLAKLGVIGAPMLMDSQAKHTVLACGGADILLRVPTRRGMHDAIWDQAAGSLIVEEAGGRVTDLAGRPLDFSAGRTLVNNHGVLASNRLLHEAVLEALQKHSPLP